MIRNEAGLFPVLMKVLDEYDENDPQTCVELFDRPEVREHAESANRVSDYLGGLWRKGLVVRTPAPKTGNHSARWAYSLKRSKPGKKAAPAPVYEFQRDSKNPNAILSKPSIEITEDGGVITIDLPQLRITIQTKN